MSFHERLRKILNDEKPKILDKFCKNFWCKGGFTVSEKDLENYPEFYKVCPKCRSFDKELSGGVTNNGIREYEGDRFDNKEHEVTVREYKSGVFRS
tara:strand:+ start:16674 stop:16961 length:288 start_codon:yes stop_codon:yes gene_type:complete